MRGEVLVQLRAERVRPDAVLRHRLLEHAIQNRSVESELGARVARVDVDELRRRAGSPPSGGVDQRIGERARPTHPSEQRGDHGRLPASGRAPDVGVRRDPAAEHRIDVIEQAFEHRPPAGRLVDVSDGADRVVIEHYLRLVARLLAASDARTEIHRPSSPTVPIRSPAHARRQAGTNGPRSRRRSTVARPAKGPTMPTPSPATGPSVRDRSVPSQRCSPIHSQHVFRRKSRCDAISLYRRVVSRARSDASSRSTDPPEAPESAARRRWHRHSRSYSRYGLHR